LLLKAEVDQTDIKVEEWRESKHQDHLLLQFQRLFGRLELSQRPAVDATSICYAFKQFDGTPTNIGVQQDCSEFLNIFFQRIEEQLKNTS
jgi:ubiquitin carboxyl-terminal hydrolase 34